MNWLTVTDGDNMFLMFHYVRRHVTGLIPCELACPSAPLGDKYLCWCVNCDFQCGDGDHLRLLISSGLTFSVVSQMALVVKDLPANAGNLRDVSSIPRWGNPLEKEMATHSSVLAWEILWTEEPGGLHSMGLQSWTRLSTCTNSKNSLCLFCLSLKCYFLCVHSG